MIPPPPRSTLFPYTTLFRSLLASRTPTLRLCFFRRAAPRRERSRDRKSTRLNSSHVSSSYAVFCLKKKSDPSPLVPLFTAIEIFGTVSLAYFIVACWDGPSL